VKQLLLTILLGSVFAADLDCPNETAYHVDLDSTSATFGETIASGQCGCLGFNSKAVATDSTLSLQINLFDNEPLRGFQLTLIEASEGALNFEWARTTGKSNGWEVWDTSNPDGSVTLLGFDLDGSETQAGSEGAFLEVLFSVSKILPSHLSFYLGEEEIFLSDRDGENVICGYPDKQNPLTLEVNRLSHQIGGEMIPENFALHPGFPNPFNPTTTIRFDLPVDSDVRLSVYDIAGREILVLVQDRFKSGKHSVEWQGVTDSGQLAPSGIYYIRLNDGKVSQTRKLTLLK
tara:strand:- start:1421 stop:2290 length:870 start_codon:yes stop_codon:yes gene_type:complete